MKEGIALLGSTGSIGVNTLDVVSRLAPGFDIIGLSADSSIGLLSIQAKKFHPKIVSVGNAESAAKIKKLVSRGTRVVFGADGLRRIVARPDVRTVVFATSGNSCLVPLIDAVKMRKRIALANKESLVSGGTIVMELAARNKVRIIPIDSEHSAIFQCLDGKREDPARIYLTASGGPLLDISANRFDRMPRNFILNHPRWKMGRKISVDSATMMNKGLEIIEATHLFGIDEKHIEVLIHPEAVIHSMVEFVDGSVLAQMAVADMRLPIQYALTFPERHAAITEKLVFPKLGALTFRRPDLRKFPCLGLARMAARSGGTAPAVLSAANEEAVTRYLKGDTDFSDIPKVIEKVLARHKNITKEKLTIGGVMEADSWAREEARLICYR